MIETVQMNKGKRKLKSSFESSLQQLQGSRVLWGFWQLPRIERWPEPWIGLCPFGLLLPVVHRRLQRAEKRNFVHNWQIKLPGSGSVGCQAWFKSCGDAQGTGLIRYWGQFYHVGPEEVGRVLWATNAITCGLDPHPSWLLMWAAQAMVNSSFTRGGDDSF